MTDNVLAKPKRGQFGRLFFSVLLALLFGSVVCFPGLITALAIRHDTELELSARMVNGMLLFAPTVVIWGGFILIMVTLILVLPMRRFHGQVPLTKWFIARGAVLGGALGALLPLRRWYRVTFPRYELWASPDYINWSSVWVILTFAGGAIFGGMYVGWVVFFERRARRSAAVAESSTAGNGGGGGTGRWAFGSLLVYGVAVVAVLWLVWQSTSGAREMKALTQATLKHQSGVLKDAQILLKEGAGARNGYASFWKGKGDADLKHFSMLGNVTCRTSGYSPGVVEVEISNSRSGLYVVPEPTSAPVAMLRREAVKGRFEYLKVVNEHVYQYGRTLW